MIDYLPFFLGQAGRFSTTGIQLQVGLVRDPKKLCSRLSRQRLQALQLCRSDFYLLSAPAAGETVTAYGLFEVLGSSQHPEIDKSVADSLPMAPIHGEVEKVVHALEAQGIDGTEHLIFVATARDVLDHDGVDRCQISSLLVPGCHCW